VILDFLLALISFNTDFMYTGFGGATKQTTSKSEFRNYKPSLLDAASARAATEKTWEE
jgi:hypothetical protein